MSVKYKKKKLFIHDMVHDNPGMAVYESNYNNPIFLKERDYDGKVFDLFNCAQYGITWDTLDVKNPEREKVYPIQSKERSWALKKQKELKEKYKETIDADLQVLFMMDMIVLPKRVLEIYPEILNDLGKIDIKAEKTREIMTSLFDEIFLVFPEVSGIYIRFGETYVGERFGTPYHTGNNPILGDAEDYHLFLIRFLQEKVCKKYDRTIFYRSWGFGDFQFKQDCYKKISDAVEVHPKFYFCIKHTAGDFNRTYRFNQCLNVGKHKQVVEVQAAREYEGKGAYPNYIGDGIINGYEEFKWLMTPDEKQSLKQLLEDEDSLIAGIWTWSRGGGWGGPYINGNNDKDGKVKVPGGSELWPDVNAYVISQWTKDPSHSDKYYALKYASEVLGMDSKDAEIFYEILLNSAHAVLLGRGCNTDLYTWDIFWTRDQNIEYARMVANISNAIEADSSELMLYEKERSVHIWKEIIALAESLSPSLKVKNYIVTTCKYGYYLYALYEVMYRANTYALLGNHKKDIEVAVKQYDSLWEQWGNLYKNSKGCPTLYEKKDSFIDLIGYDWNKGFDSAINPLRELDAEGKILVKNRIKAKPTNEWGLTGEALN